ncbi:MAG: hypothetical protein EPN86_01345 [Nanoarchaeota archaeon]|nr:MAG: hypothetical protein EPN86_01345 [Nanoarchaeota archaeon]
MRKGIIFTLMALLAVGLLLLLLIPQQTEFGLQRQTVVRSRVQVTDDYVRDLREIYLPQTIYVTGYQTLNSLAVYTGNQSGLFPTQNSFKQAFKEVLLNGTYRGTDINLLTQPGLYGQNLTSRLIDLQNASKNYLFINTNFTLNYDGIDVDVYQTNLTSDGGVIGPFQVAIAVLLNYTVNIGDAYWNKSDNITAVFSIEGLQDPLYIASTKGNKTNFIRRANYNLSGEEAFLKFVQNSSYTYNNESPGFIQRFYNDTNPSPDGCCGIESFVPPDVDDYFKPRGSTVINTSFVDCNYFGGVCSSRLGKAANTSWFVNIVTNATYQFEIDQYRAFTIYYLNQSVMTQATTFP